MYIRKLKGNYYVYDDNKLIGKASRFEYLIYKLKRFLGVL